MQILSIISVCVLIGCFEKTGRAKERRVWTMIRSQNVDSIIRATEEIRESRDRSMVYALLYDAFDPRITHNFRCKGSSIYQIKMQALKEVTGVSPPVPIMYEVDTSVVDFYRQYLRQHKMQDTAATAND